MTRKIKNLIKDFSISSFNYSGGMGGGEAGVDPPTTTKGDLSGFDTTFDRVPIGSNTQVLTADSTEALGLKWATPTDIAPPTTTKGDISGFSTLQARIPIGANDQVLTADSTQALGLAWKTSGGGVEYSQLTTVATFTPTTQTGLVKVTVDGTDMTGGSVDINVDGSAVSNTSFGATTTRVINPSSSLTVKSKGGNINGMVYDNKLASVNSQDNQMRDIFFKSDGTKMYAIGRTNAKAYQYSLSTAWDIDTLSYDSVFFSVSETTDLNGLTMNPDGTKMYIGGGANVYQYTLSTAWNLSTASYASKTLNTSSQESGINGIKFNNDGTKFYIIGGTISYQYTVSTAYDISTASYASKSFNVSAQESDVSDFDFMSDGSKMFVIGDINDTFYQYSLSTAWDISTASYDSLYFSVSSQTSSPSRFVLTNNDTQIFLQGISSGSRKVLQYSSNLAFIGTARISVG